MSAKKILIVDDDPRLRDLLRRYLGENQFDVSQAHDGPSMQRLMQRETFDLLILDLPPGTGDAGEGAQAGVGQPAAKRRNARLPVA